MTTFPIWRTTSKPGPPARFFTRAGVEVFTTRLTEEDALFAREFGLVLERRKTWEYVGAQYGEYYFRELAA